MQSAIRDSGLSPTELSRRSGVSYRTIFGIMRGDGNPRGKTIFKVATALGMTPSDLLKGKPARNLEAARVDYTQHGLPPGGHVVRERGAPDPLPTPPDVLDAIRVLSQRLKVDELSVIEKVAEIWRESLKRAKPAEEKTP